MMPKAWDYLALTARQSSKGPAVDEQRTVQCIEVNILGWTIG